MRQKQRTPREPHSSRVASEEASGHAAAKTWGLERAGCLTHHPCPGPRPWPLCLAWTDVDVLWVPKFVPSLSPSTPTVSGPRERNKPVFPGLVRGSCPFQSHPLSQCWGDAQLPFKPPLQTAKSLPGYRPTCAISLCPSRFCFFFFKSDLKIRFPIKTWVSSFLYPVGSVCLVTGWSWVAAALPGRVARVPAGHGPRHSPLSYTTNCFAHVSVAGATGVWDLTIGCGSDLAGLCDSCSQRTPLEPAGVPVSCVAQ